MVIENRFFLPDYIKKINPYQAGKPIEELAREFNIDPKCIVKLASNENPLGVSDSVLNIITQSFRTISRYPDANGFDLKYALSKKYSIPIENIVLGNGSNDILELISLAFLDNRSSAIYSEYSFAVYKIATQARGSRHIQIPSIDYKHDLKKFYDAISDDTRLIFIANPNNPTGTFIPKNDIIDFLDSVYKKYSSKVLVVLDEAYTEYLDEIDRFDSFSLIQKYPNLIVVRTFSKAYGLAGLRVGFSVSHPDIADFINRVRQPFNVNSLAQLAAIAALEDQDFLYKSCVLNKEEKHHLYESFDSLNLEYIPSFGNFVLVKVGNAKNINFELLKRGIIVRPVDNYGLSEWLRVTIGKKLENTLFLNTLKDIINKV
ncbi:histidinol-phosphate transaminase [Candidatus Kinetoplastidibacterium crithidiae]|uniref:Histidinol-phosphate aminotransferase n=1 Tax=Candidatus Kinetoplastidibacterium crithidiae TCC036E TaxID=1208918 RepID=M1L4X0_9PROT|nr:histidinol-phosphate transaminase [Candidatus Kinetoplastibacterium crithidii]AFZ82626.1 histidinol-phosphate aminotransferase [Candidatus Kinetoplastibacterium crithidii (ex Angomonas deanei ATCC 30255)]AGF47713.1 histidinol-phosphate aminotransferase [Candidatus Kinetoplastibacterium crithidii TCC036E]